MLAAEAVEALLGILKVHVACLAITLAVGFSRSGSLKVATCTPWHDLIMPEVQATTIR